MFKKEDTNPFRFRSMYNAQQLIDCSIEDCFLMEKKVREGLERFER